MHDRIRAAVIALVTFAGLFAAPLASRAATPPKVVIIVGPTGSVTSSYRSQGDQIASAAAADGATVVKVYSPNATWAKVKAAVAGANIIVYLGHGNGFPNPYTTTFMPDRTDGWGLNRTTTNGDADNWSTTMVYCGEKALTGQLTSSDGLAQRTYCAGGPITPAAGFVMIYSNACYAPGASEPQNPAATAWQALQRVSYYSRLMITTLRAGGYFATDHGATPLVHSLLTKPTTSFGAIYNLNVPSVVVVRNNAHLLVSWARVYLGYRSTNPYYTYAFAGDPTRTLAMSAVTGDTTRPIVASSSPVPDATGVSMTPVVSLRFSESVTGVSAATVRLQYGTTVLAATLSYDSATKTAVLKPTYVLAPGVPYSVSVASGIHDLAGNALSATAWRLTTARTEAYGPARTLTFAAGTYVGYTFSSTGAVIGQRSGTLSRPSNAPTDVRSAITSHSGGWYHVAAGIWAGYWVRENSGITLH